MSFRFGFLVFPNVQQLDLTGPYEMFASATGAQMHLVWKDLAPVRSATGLMLTPTHTLADCPQLDVICIPGGAGVNALLLDEDVLQFVREQAAGARYVTSVCTGALVLGAAGLLKWKRATTHWNAVDYLARFGATHVEARIVKDGNLITAGGVTAGIDFGLAVVAELMGQHEAERVQLSLEYDPHPPFSSGTPRQASPQLLALARERIAPSIAAREAIVAEWEKRTATV
ncbi:DJ-1/PfpI family protein [Phyllobacterium pellucidum]|uniref:DJ-1/PfpI family protein n=1 Tax=Phyllobacterium pellucidum TaxID=2740464 RepID=UPI001D15C9DB|nr:DJ-1/PfpI family protein [Phyllobacterium sp. T1018]UGY09657.1 DJ-1/PfpI family protein [Phyllobacterium sp. T1018]